MIGGGVVWLVIVSVGIWLGWKWGLRQLTGHNVFFYQYPPATQRRLTHYGDWPVRRWWVVRQPFGKPLTRLLNLLTLGHYQTVVEAAPATHQPYHTQLWVEVMSPTTGMGTWLVLEKNSSVCLTDRFSVRSGQEWHELSHVPPTHTLRDVLTQTHDRLGSSQFFNWHLKKHHCQSFTRDLVTTLEAWTPEVEAFVQCDQLLHELRPSEWTLWLTETAGAWWQQTERDLDDWLSL
jgi:hypothetical protein